jgi:hypothetical protein
MPLAIASKTEDVALNRRMALAGSSGPLAAFQNLRVVGIALFACLGGLLYGYNQGVFSGMSPVPLSCLVPLNELTTFFWNYKRCINHGIFRQPYGRLHI